MKEDARFNTPYLTAEQKFELFRDFMRDNFNKKRKDFRDLLDENRFTINPFSSWDSVKDTLQDD